MGFQAAAVVLEGGVDVAAALDVVARLAPRVGCEAAEVFVAPRLAWDVFVEEPLGVVAVLAREALFGADLLAHALHRALGRGAVAVAASDVYQVGAYELCDDARSGGLAIQGAVHLGGARVPYAEAPRLGVEALLGRPAARAFDLAELFDAAEAAPDAARFVLPRPGAAPKRVPRRRWTDPCDAVWGWSLVPLDPGGAQRRHAALSKPLP